MEFIPFSLPCRVTVFQPLSCPSFFQLPRQHILNISATSISAVSNLISPYFLRPLVSLSMILFLYSTLGEKKKKVVCLTHQRNSHFLSLALLLMLPSPRTWFASASAGPGAPLSVLLISAPPRPCSLLCDGFIYRSTARSNSRARNYFSQAVCSPLMASVAFLSQPQPEAVAIYRP